MVRLPRRKLVLAAWQRVHGGRRGRQPSVWPAPTLQQSLLRPGQSENEEHLIQNLSTEEYRSAISKSEGPVHAAACTNLKNMLSESSQMQKATLWNDSIM